MSFPTSPTEGQRSDEYIYNSTLGAWESISDIEKPFIFGSPVRSTGGDGLANRFDIKKSSGLSFSGDGIILPYDGMYSISYTTISGNNLGRFDAAIYLNGVGLIALLSETNLTGYHQKSGSITSWFSKGDKIGFSNANWFNYVATSYDVWKSASITFIG